MREHIFEPIGMNYTSMASDFSDNQWVKIQREKLKCYSITLDSKESFGSFISYILLYPAGSATGTIEDLIKFAKAFTTKDEISPFFRDENTLKTILSASSYYGKPESISGLERNFHGLWSMEYGTQVKGHAGIFLIVMGGVMLIKPNLMWKISESWKTKSNSGATDLYILIVRIAGIILAIGGIVAFFIN